MLRISMKPFSIRFIYVILYYVPVSRIFERIFRIGSLFRRTKVVRSRISDHGNVGRRVRGHRARYDEAAEGWWHHDSRAHYCRYSRECIIGLITAAHCADGRTEPGRSQHRWRPNFANHVNNRGWSVFHWPVRHTLSD